MSLTRIRMLSPNYSSRGGGKVRLIVLHTAEGARTIQSLGSFFGNSSSGVSSHTGIDDTPNTVGEYVDRNMKAWTAANANPVAVQTELCAFAAWDLNTWNSHSEMLNNCAKWIAEEAAIFGIPLVKLTPQQAQSNGVGICQHIDLGSWGGGHVDCGSAFPIDRVISMAQGGSTPEPPTPIEEDDVFPPCKFTMTDNSQHAFYVGSNGQLVHSYFVPGKPWVSEGLSTGWDSKTGLALSDETGTYQVWGILANGKGAQCYWSGKNWVTQSLP